MPRARELAKKPEELDQVAKVELWIINEGDALAGDSFRFEDGETTRSEAAAAIVQKAETIVRWSKELPQPPLPKDSDWFRFCAELEEAQAVAGRILVREAEKGRLPLAAQDALAAAFRKVRDAAYQAGRTERSKADFDSRFPQGL